ncbi:MAG: hypothetical protein G3M70_04905 [Candidatus Nitronauta litoralis]|uniref:Chlorite dismutase n=1 Tax=Candidatus Nitronauta litoralis TaxID=2705533 RepID=A0A7T0FZJ9_9BACT|nr:MAG: hypothetical protein G3M70_04905 [Candidatus Nitronauta litoralis]
MQTRNFKAVCLFAVLFNLAALNAWAVQGQWGAFIYLFPKSGAVIDDSAALAPLAEKISQASSGFSNDFTPQKGKTDTAQFIRITDYLLNGNPVLDKPTGLIRVESTDRKVLDDYVETLARAVKGYFRLETRFAVTRQLNYTDAETLKRLKDNAPKRGNGTEQPNAVVFPLSKTKAWWALTQEKRQNFFLGHNAVGFQHIKRIFRKLYHSRFVDPGQDFMTYFEYADADADKFDALLSGLRDKTLNPEWGYVEEKPIVYGKRTATPAEMLKPKSSSEM